MTVDNWIYYVYRYEENLNSIENAMVLIRYPKDAFHVSEALQIFIRTDVSLSVWEKLDKYMERSQWKYSQSKDKRAFDRHQISSSKGIQRYWLLMSLAHFFMYELWGNYALWRRLCFYFQSYPRGTNPLHLPVWSKAHSFWRNLSFSGIIYYLKLNDSFYKNTLLTLTSYDRYI